MSEAHTEEKPAPFMPMSGVRLLQVFILGAIVGAAVWGLTLFLDKYVFQAILCHGVQSMQCVSGESYAEVSATILSAGIGLYFLVRMQVFRSLLVVLSVLISLWGIIGFTEFLPWYGVGLAAIGLYAIAYVFFVWIARIRIFWLVLVLLLISIVGIRLILSA